MAGGYDYLPRIVLADLDYYRLVHMGHFAAVAGVHHVQTEIPLQQIKHTTELSV